MQGILSPGRRLRRNWKSDGVIKWRISAGDWRVIMRILHDKGEIVFEIVEVIQRKDAYR